MDNSALMSVQVAYAASPQEQFLRTVTVPIGSNVQQVIEAANILSLYPEINLQKNAVGIAHKVVTLDTIVRPRDRIEIYRPLIFDPMTARRARATR